MQHIIYTDSYRRTGYNAGGRKKGWKKIRAKKIRQQDRRLAKIASGA